MDESRIRSLAEQLMARVFREVFDIELQLPFPSLTYTLAMERYSSDKPDMRCSGLEMAYVHDLATEQSAFR